MNRLKTLEEAKALCLAGEYREALALTATLLLENPRDVDSLRLKGNILELQVLEREANQEVKHTYSPEFGKARACYEQILLIEPDHPGALTDLGSHWKNLGDTSKALDYFDRMLALHRDQKHENRDELIEAMEGKIEILKQQGDIESARRLIEELKIIAA